MRGNCTTTMIFKRYRSGRPFPRYVISYLDGGFLVTRTFHSKVGCRLFARRHERAAAWFRES